MANCIIADCNEVGEFLKVIVCYFAAFIICCCIPCIVYCAITKASFLFYRCWKAINERSDNLRPTFSNVSSLNSPHIDGILSFQARKLAQVTWSELYFTQRQIEESRFQLSKELSSIETIKRKIQKDVAEISRLPQRRQVYFVEPHRRSSSSTRSSSSSATSSVGRSTAC